MEAPQTPQEAAPSVPELQLLRDMLGDGSIIYHFYEDGIDTRLTMVRELSGVTPNDYSYHLIFDNWLYGDADISIGPEGVCLEWAGVADTITNGHNDLEKLEAEKFMRDADTYLIPALKADFPGLPILNFEGESYLP